MRLSPSNAPPRFCSEWSLLTLTNTLSQNKAVPAQYLTPLTETVGLRAQSRCRFPGCGKMSVRTDRAKEHARVHIGNHPYSCERIQADGRIGWYVVHFDRFPAASQAPAL